MPGTLASVVVPRRVIGITAGCLAALVLSAVLAGPASGATRVSYRAFDSNPVVTKKFFDKGGLQLIGECAVDDTMSIRVRSTVDDAMVHANSQGMNTLYFEDDDFDAGLGDEFELGNVLEDDSSAGQIVYGRPGGSNVSVDWLAEEADGFSGSRDCVFTGTARFVDSSSSGRANYRFDQPNGPTTFYNQGGLKLIGQCSLGGLSVTAMTSTDNSMLYANSQSGGNLDDAEANNDFDIAEPFLVQDAVSGGVVDDAIGQIVYAKPGGTNVTVDWAAEDGGNALGRDCVFNGVARVRSSGDSLRVNFRVPSGTTGLTTFFNQGGLKLLAECQSGPALQTYIHTASDGAMVHYNGQAGSTDGSFEEDFFDTDPDDRLLLAGTIGINEQNLSGQIVYSEPGVAGGTNVTVRYAAEEGDGFGSFPCVFVGTAEVGTK